MSEPTPTAWTYESIFPIKPCCGDTFLDEDGSPWIIEDVGEQVDFVCKRSTIFKERHKWSITAIPTDVGRDVDAGTWVYTEETT